MGKFPEEVQEALTEADLLEFTAFYKLQAEAEKKAYEQARAKAG